MKEVIQLYAMEFRIFSPFSPYLLRLKEIVTMHSIMLEMRSMGQKKVVSAIKV